MYIKQTSKKEVTYMYIIHDMYTYMYIYIYIHVYTYGYTYMYIYLDIMYVYLEMYLYKCMALFRALSETTDLPGSSIDVPEGQKGVSSRPIHDKVAPVTREGPWPR